MKINFLFTLQLIVLIHFLGYSSNNNFSQPSDFLYEVQDTNCLKIFRENIRYFKKLDYQKMDYYFTYLNPELSLSSFLDCTVQLANSENHQAKDEIISFAETLYEKLHQNKNYHFYHKVKIILRNSIGKISSAEAFNLGMKFFNLNISSHDLIANKKFITDQPNDNFGLTAFQMILVPMMISEQQTYYQQLEKKLFKEYIFNNDTDNDSGMKKFHKILYPIIKKDWEEGKIKLRE